jgi:hypothetical protein
VKVNDWGSFYSCEADNFKTSLSERSLSKIEGTHSEGKRNDEVRRLYMKEQDCVLLPLNLDKYFKNLEILYVKRSNVRYLVDGDLNGLNKLRTFDISYNPIDHLGSNFFKGHESIETISFFECNLKFVDPQALTHLTKLTEAYFDNNLCTNYRCTHESCIKEVKFVVSEQCQSKETVPFSIEKIDVESPTETSSSAGSLIGFLIIGVILIVVIIVVKKIYF